MVLRAGNFDLLCSCSDLEYTVIIMCCPVPKSLKGTDGMIETTELWRSFGRKKEALSEAGEGSRGLSTSVYTFAMQKGDANTALKGAIV